MSELSPGDVKNDVTVAKSPYRKLRSRVPFRGNLRNGLLSPTILNADWFGYTVAVKIVAAVVVLLLMARSGVAQDAASRQGSSASESTAQSKSLPESKSPQTDESTTEIPMFHAQSRQVIVEAEVWEKNNGKNRTGHISGDSKALRGYQQGDSRMFPPPARGLTAAIFHVFDNGTAQAINYFREEDFATVDITNQWVFFPTVSGTWGYSTSHALSGFDPATATYLIGYIPPPLKPGECHTIRVVADNQDVVWLNRPQYCAADASDAKKEVELRSRMERVLNSEDHQSDKVHIQASVFWASGVLALAGEAQQPTNTTAQPANAFTYVVEVHDSKAPAGVHISTSFNLFPWAWNCREDERKELHILGAIHDMHGQIAGQFADRYTCRIWKSVSQFIPDGLAAVPSRFDTDLDLRPGDYEVRVVVSDGIKFGQSKFPLHIEPLDPQRIGISDVAVCDFLRDASWILRDAASVSPFPINPAPLVSKDVQFFPATDNRVRHQTPLSFYFEIYKSSLDGDETVLYYNVRVIDLKTEVLVMNTGPMSAAKWVIPGNTVIPIGLNLDIKKLPTGSYELEVQASDAAGRESEWRGAKFNIQ
jgi:hypothetical protein